MGKNVVESGSSSLSSTSRRSYDAMVYKDTMSGYTIAVDEEGNIISKVLSASNIDNVVIQAAIDYGVIIVLKDNMNIGGTITIKTDSKIIYGNNNKITLKDNSDVNMIENVAGNGRNVSIYDLTLDGNGTNQTANVDCINLENCSSWYLYNTHLINAKRSGLKVDIPGWIYILKNCGCAGCGGYGVDIHCATTVRLEGCFFETNYGNVKVEASEVKISHCWFDYCYGNNIHLYLAIVHGSIHDNYFIDNSGSITGGIYLNTCAVVSVHGNTFRTLKGVSIDDYCCINISVTGNKIYGNTGDAIKISGIVSSYETGVYTGNVVESNVSANVLNVSTEYSQCLVMGNTFKAGIVTISSGSTVVYNNLFVGCTYNIGTYKIIKYNRGYFTERYGTTATIVAGNTYVDVTHNLSATPTSIRVTPTTNLGNRSLWVDTKGAATFRININSSDVIDHTFDWEAEV